jgi:hypothetical protein
LLILIFFSGVDASRLAIALAIRSRNCSSSILLLLYNNKIAVIVHSDIILNRC